jgi:hypothetical protein
MRGPNVAVTAADRKRGTRAADLIEARLRSMTVSPPLQRTSAPDAAKPWLDDLLGRNDTYRDATLAILAFPVAEGAIVDIRLAPPSRRGVTQRITETCRSLSIPHRQDAFQTLGKGNARLDGLDRDAWCSLLGWASVTATFAEVSAAFDYFAEGVARLARPLPPMPELAIRQLTFPKLAMLFDEMLGRPSRGAHEQFILAALLAAAAEEEGTLRAETKPLNASDRSAGTAADIQLWRRGVLEEAYEATASHWQVKIRQATDVQVRTDLNRVHIVGDAAVVSGREIVEALTQGGLPADTDLSVLDIRHEIRSLVARLGRQSRQSALATLYSYLVGKQPDDGLVVRYVDLLHSIGLVLDE